MKTTELTEATILFAGDSGDGMQLTGSQFTNTVAHMGNDLSTLPDFPAEIRAPIGTVAGVSGFKIHFGSIEINSPGDKCDVLVAMNAAAFKKNIALLKETGILIYNSDGFDHKNLRLAHYENNPIDEVIKSKYKVYDIDITKQTNIVLKDFDLSTKDKERSKNMFALGFIYWLFSKPLEFSEEYIETKFGSSPTLMAANLEVLKTGYKYGEISEAFENRYKVQKAKLSPGNYRNISGNEALAIGLIAASQKSGLELFYGGYPITPASDILHYLNLYKYLRVKTFQAEDEIAGITSAIGASYAGALGVTASSGPGIALKTEGMGLAFMLEIPLVIINVQRGGPSTGLPTKTEQADLGQAVYGRNGEAPIPVFAPATPSDCFEIVYFASKIALEFNTPVMVLSDGYLANGSEPWNYPSSDNLDIITPRKTSLSHGYEPYLRDDLQRREMAYPGMPGIEHRIGGLEKENISGDISYDGDNHQLMIKLRQEKVNHIAQYYPKTELDQSHPEAEILILSWGSTYGAIRTAVSQLIKDNQPVAHLHLRYINPLPLDLGNILKQYKKILIPELNNGQLIRIIRDVYLVDAKGINKIKGQPFTSNEIYEAIMLHTQV